MFFTVSPTTGLTERSMNSARELEKRDEIVIPPGRDLQSIKGRGISLEIPAEGYILDLAVFYDNNMTKAFGDMAETRYLQDFLHTRLWHQGIPLMP